MRNGTMKYLGPVARGACVALVVLAGCGADKIVFVDSASRTATAQVGQEVEITLGNVGPGEYESPPTMSSAILTYLGVDVVAPFNPGGPNQRFRFRAVSAGQTVVHFRRTLNGTILNVVDDT